ncbi:MAG TPA: hypothetical protein VJS66_00015 [Burkholderiales bacterium]|nr:hypothetical protein [Burkholderiales bacterium]
MSTTRRIMLGVGANGFGQAITMLIQIASVPILIGAWGLELYGEWIILSAVPTYLALCDIGLTAVAGNSLALLAGKLDEPRMLTVYQSAWAMVSAISAVILILVAVGIWFTEPGDVLGLTRIAGATLSVTLLLLFFHVALSMQTGLLQLPFKAMKRDPFAVAAVNIIRLLEWSTATIVVLMGGAVVAVAFAFVLARLCGNLSLLLMLHRSDSTLRLGIDHISMETIRTLIRPSLASMCFPVGLSFTMQGFILLVGHMIGAGGVALFNVYRTFTRVPIQLATTINQAVWPELSYAVGAHDIGKARRLVVKMLQVSVTLSAAAVLIVYLAGERVIDLWVSRALEHNSQVLAALTLTALVHILWQPFWVAQVATNRHVYFALLFLLVSALSLVFGWWFLGEFKLTGAGYAVLLSECLMALAAFVTFRRYFATARQ